MSDTAIFLGAAILFAIAVTAHVAIAAGLALRSPRWRGLVALVAPPLAPYWAFQSGMRVRATAWVGAVLAYVVLRAVLWR